MNLKLVTRLSILLISIYCCSSAANSHKISQFKIYLNDEILEDVVNDSIYLIDPNFRTEILGVRYIKGEIIFDKDDLETKHKLSKYGSGFLWLRFSIVDKKAKLREYQTFFIIDIFYDNRKIRLNIFDFNLKVNRTLKNNYLSRLKSDGIKRFYRKKISYCYDFIYPSKGIGFNDYRTLIIYPHVPPYIDYVNRKKMGLNYGCIAGRVVESVESKIIE